MKPLLLLLLFFLLLITSCKAPSDIVYVQDLQPQSLTPTSVTSAISVRPEDKLRIVVNSHDETVSSIFNLHQETGRSASSSQNLLYYTIAPDGTIDFPVLGPIPVAGLTRAQVADVVKTHLIQSDMIKDPVVTVEFANLTYSVLGEVHRPGRFPIDKDHVTLLDALSQAGDLTITGRRTDVKVMREVDGQIQTYTVDLTSGQSLLQSPVYHLCQNDVVYVAPNKKSAFQSTQNGNTVRSTSFWTSLISLAITVCLFVKNL